MWSSIFWKKNRIRLLGLWLSGRNDSNCRTPDYHGNTPLTPIFFKNRSGRGISTLPLCRGQKMKNFWGKFFCQPPLWAIFVILVKSIYPSPNRFSKKIGVRGWCHGNRACAGGSRQFRMIKNSQKHVIDPCLIGPVQVQINRLAFLVFYNRPVLGKNSNKHSKVTNGPGSSRFTLVINMTHNLWVIEKSKKLTCRGCTNFFARNSESVGIESLGIKWWFT